MSRARVRVALAITVATVVSAVGLMRGSRAEPRWTDETLRASYRELRATGALEDAVRAPVLPREQPEHAFLDALAWFAAGSGRSSGVLTRDELDGFLDRQVRSYAELLEAHVERARDNDYARTRTWKLIQKLSLLREAMSDHPMRHYAYPGMTTGSDDDGRWDREHTLSSREDFVAKVCEPSFERPILVKFGNSNCTQCMLFEMTGAVRAFARRHEASELEVYKVWWGLPPDESFAGAIDDPARLDDLVRAEDVTSSPTFVVYRKGRRYACEGGFPDSAGHDMRLDRCLREARGPAPYSSVCGAGPGDATELL